MNASAAGENVCTMFCRALAVTAVIVALSGCGPFFFYPSRELLPNPAAAMFSPRDVYFKTSDGLQLHGWLFTARENRGTVLALHGNAENLSTHVNSVLWLVPQGYNLFIFDYRGYGKSDGRPDIKGIQRDAEAAIETLFSMQGVNMERVVVLGQSIGGAVAVAAIARSPYKDRIGALVIESAFADYRLILREKLGQTCVTWPFQHPLSLTVNNEYSPLKWIPAVSPVPVLILHGEHDFIVPIHHGRLLYEAAREPKAFWPTETPGHIASFAEASVRKRFLDYLKGL